MKENTFEVQDISFSYGNNNLLQNISFSLKTGDMASIVGLNGSGKSTLLRILAGKIRPSTGNVFFNGKAVYKELDKLIPIEKGIVLFTKEHQIRAFTTVLENVQIHFKNNKKEAIQLLQDFGLAEFADKKPEILSFGQQSKLNFAIGLAQKPSIILLDESLQNIDFETKHTIYSILLNYTKREGAILINVSHDFEENLILANNTFVLNNGQLSSPVALFDFYYRPRLIEYALYSNRFQRVSKSDFESHLVALNLDLDNVTDVLLPRQVQSGKVALKFIEFAFWANKQLVQVTTSSNKSLIFKLNTYGKNLNKNELIVRFNSSEVLFYHHGILKNASVEKKKQ